MASLIPISVLEQNPSYPSPFAFQNIPNPVYRNGPAVGPHNLIPNPSIGENFWTENQQVGEPIFKDGKIVGGYTCYHLNPWVPVEMTNQIFNELKSLKMEASIQLHHLITHQRKANSFINKCFRGIDSLFSTHLSGATFESMVSRVKNAIEKDAKKIRSLLNAKRGKNDREFYLSTIKILMGMQKRIDFDLALSRASMSKEDAKIFSLKHRSEILKQLDHLIYQAANAYFGCQINVETKEITPSKRKKEEHQQFLIDVQSRKISTKNFISEAYGWEAKHIAD